MTLSVCPRRTADAAAFWTPTPADLPNVEKSATHYWNSVSGPQRGWMLEAIAALGGAASVLEVGCQCGPNLRILSRYYPSMRLVGLDINAHAIEAGRRFCLSEHVGATFIEGSVPDALQTMPDGSVDVVLSTYMLAYIDADDIDHAVLECLRVARRAVIFIEPMAVNGQESFVLVEGSDYIEWRHDYLDILAQQPSLRIAWVAKPPYDTLTGMVIAAKEGPDGQPIR